MPVQPCQEDGEHGYRWGQSGKCYTGKNAQRKALQQGVAIEKDKQRRGEPSYFDAAHPAEIILAEALLADYSEDDDEEDDLDYYVKRSNMIPRNPSERNAP